MRHFPKPEKKRAELVYVREPFNMAKNLSKCPLLLTILIYKSLKVCSSGIKSWILTWKEGDIMILRSSMSHDSKMEGVLWEGTSVNCLQFFSWFSYNSIDLSSFWISCHSAVKFHPSAPHLSSLSFLVTPLFSSPLKKKKFHLCLLAILGFAQLSGVVASHIIMSSEGQYSFIIPVKLCVQ